MTTAPRTAPSRFPRLYSLLWRSGGAMGNVSIAVGLTLCPLIVGVGLLADRLV